MRSARRCDDGSGARVVLQNGEYWLRNNGDLAMLDSTVARIRERWPRAVISVLTSAPSLLRASVPGVRPLSDGRMSTFAAPLWRAAELAGPAAVGPLSSRYLHVRQELLERVAGLRGRRDADPAALPAAGPTRSDDAPAQAPADAPADGSATLSPDLLQEIERATLVLAIGGGYLTDVDGYQTTRTLALLEAAVDRGVPTALLGQGLGPLTDPALVAHARTVLPRVDLIGLREGRRGPVLLDQLGVPAERVVVTGDDAIELAASARAQDLGPGLGVCLRVAEYSPVTERAVAAVGQALRAVAAEHDAPLVPLIISEYRSEDRRSTLPLVEGVPGAVPPLGRYVGARAVAQRVARCRVIVTGAYHLAVFALAQGIPVVGLTSSEYYDDKFLGLLGMFEGGLELVHLGAPDLEATLAGAIRSAWDRAPQQRASLRARADVQILRSRALLGRAFELVDGPAPRRTEPVATPA